MEAKANDQCSNVRQPMEILPMDAANGMAYVRVCGCCTERGGLHWFRYGCELNDSTYGLPGPWIEYCDLGFRSLGRTSIGLG